MVGDVFLRIDGNGLSGRRASAGWGERDLL